MAFWTELSLLCNGVQQNILILAWIQNYVRLMITCWDYEISEV
jgi:hypothetical protein